MCFICAPCKKNVKQHHETIRGEISNLNNKLDAMFAQLISKSDEDRKLMEQAFEQAVGNFKKEMSSMVDALKGDVGK